MLVSSTRHEFFRHVDLHGLAKAEVCAKKKHIFSNTTQIHRASMSFFVLGHHRLALPPSRGVTLDVSRMQLAHFCPPQTTNPKLL